VEQESIFEAPAPVPLLKVFASGFGSSHPKLLGVGSGLDSGSSSGFVSTALVLTDRVVVVAVMMFSYSICTFCASDGMNVTAFKNL